MKYSGRARADERREPGEAPGRRDRLGDRDLARGERPAMLGRMTAIGAEVDQVVEDIAGRRHRAERQEGEPCVEQDPELVQAVRHDDRREKQQVLGPLKRPEQPEQTPLRLTRTLAVFQVFDSHLSELGPDRFDLRLALQFSRQDVVEEPEMVGHRPRPSRICVGHQDQSPAPVAFLLQISHDFRDVGQRLGVVRDEVRDPRPQRRSTVDRPDRHRKGGSRVLSQQQEETLPEQVARDQGPIEVHTEQRL